MDDIKEKLKKAFENLEVPYNEEDEKAMAWKLKRYRTRRAFSRGLKQSMWLLLLVVLISGAIRYVLNTKVTERKAEKQIAMKESHEAVELSGKTNTAIRPETERVNTENFAKAEKSKVAGKYKLAEEKISGYLPTSDEVETILPALLSGGKSEPEEPIKNFNPGTSFRKDTLKRSVGDKGLVIKTNENQEVVQASSPAENLSDPKTTETETGLEEKVKNPVEEAMSSASIPGLVDSLSMETEQTKELKNESPQVLQTVISPATGGYSPAMIIHRFRDNPAYAGVYGKPSLNLFYHGQKESSVRYTSYADISGEFNFGKNKNNGAGFFYSRLESGLSAISTANLAGSHKFYVSGKKSISLGGGASFINKRVFWNRILFGDMNNGSSLEKYPEHKSIYYYDVSTGLVFLSRNVFAGISVIQVFNPQGTRAPLEYNFITAYHLRITDKLNISPAVKIKNAYKLMAYSPSLFINYDDLYFISLAYQNLNTLAGGVGIQIRSLRFMLASGMFIDKELYIHRSAPFIEAGLRYQKESKK